MGEKICKTILSHEQWKMSVQLKDVLRECDNHRRHMLHQFMARVDASQLCTPQFSAQLEYECMCRVFFIQKLAATMSGAIANTAEEPLYFARLLYSLLTSRDKWRRYGCAMRSAAYNICHAPLVQARIKDACGGNGEGMGNRSVISWLLDARPEELWPERWESALKKRRTSIPLVTDASVDVDTGTSTIKCPKCKERKTFHTLAQTRSADEPMTVFASCVACGYRWKFS